MARHLDMLTQERIKALLALGWPERRVARETGVHRNTVRCGVIRLQTEDDDGYGWGTAGNRPPVRLH